MQFTLLTPVRRARGSGAHARPSDDRSSGGGRGPLCCRPGLPTPHSAPRRPSADALTAA